jgi:dienelactone hydrolase
MRLVAGATLLLALACAGCGSSGPHTRLTATPRVSLLDAPVHVRLTGARAGERVTITASERSWHSRAVFRAGADGTVDVARDRSLSGTYTGRSEMGLFWSLATQRGSVSAAPEDGATVCLRAVANRRELASTTLERRARDPSVAVRKATLARDGFVGRHYAPPHPHGAPVLIFGGSDGGLISTEPALLASHDHPTLALAYFDEPGLPRSLVRIPLEYFVRAIRWLDRQPGVDPRRLTVSGVSRGSEPALLLGADFPRLVHAVVALDPSSLVQPGLPADRISSVPAWTLHGKPIPYPSAIPVEKIRGPVFLAAGAADALWNSWGYEQQIVDRLHTHGRRDVTALSYGDAGHALGFAVPNVPLDTVLRSRYGTLDLGGSRPADARARADLWPKLLRFLDAVPGRGS